MVGGLGSRLQRLLGLLPGWLASWLTDGLAGWLTHSLTDWLAGLQPLARRWKLRRAAREAEPWPRADIIPTWKSLNSQGRGACGLGTSVKVAQPAASQGSAAQTTTGLTRLSRL